MKFTITTLAIGLASLVARGVIASTAQVDCTNSTANATSPSANITTTTTTTTTSASLVTIFTPFPNGTVEPLSIHLYNLTASVDKASHTANYNFEFVIDPDTNAMQCNATVHSHNGELSDVRSAQCWQDEPWARLHNYTMPAKFSFAWTTNTPNGTTLLALRSTNPGSAGRCPYFPRDACWAQALYWVAPRDVLTFGGVDEYVGDSVVHLDGMYCRSGMEECVWSEYLYE